jgi:hypothetical protein
VTLTETKAAGTGEAPSPRRRRDPLPALAAVVALAVYLPHGLDGYLTRDIGLYSYAGQRAAEGVPPYLGVLNRAGPLAHLIPGIGATAARVLHTDDLFTMRVLFLLLAVACVVVTYLLGRDLFRSRAAGLAAAATMLSFHAVVTYATYGPREKTSLLLFILCGLLALTHQRWATAGAFVALATLTWQPVLPAALAGAVVAALLGLRAGRLKALLRIAVGGLVPAVLTVGFYAAIGELRVFWDDFFLINAHYTEQITILEDRELLEEVMLEGYGWTFWLYVAGSAAFLLLTAAVVLSGRARRDARTAAVVGTGVYLLIGVYWSTRAFNGWADNFFILPQAALGVAGLAVLLRRLLGDRVTMAAAVGWVGVATALTLVFSIGTRDTRLEVQRDEVAAVTAVLPPDARIVSVEAPQPLVLSDRRNVGRIQLFGNGMLDYLDDTWPGGRDGFARRLVSHRPELFALGMEGSTKWFSPTLVGAYECVGQSPGWYWFARSDLGERRLQELRQASGGGSCEGA